MTRQRTAAAVLIALALAGVLAAAAFSGSTEERPFAVNGSLECPPFDVGQPVSEEERKYGAEYFERAAREFIDRRVSVVAAPRSPLLVDFFEFPSFREQLTKARTIVVGRVSDQRLANSHGTRASLYSLVSSDAKDMVVYQPIFPGCFWDETRAPPSVTLGYLDTSPALVAGTDYALVLGPKDSGGAAAILLAFEVSRDRLTALYPTRDSPLDDGASLAELVALLPLSARPCVISELQIGCDPR